MTCAVCAHAGTLTLPNTDELTGDAKLACEAILCLSSAAGAGMAECGDALSRYFSFDGINAIVDRINFLHACPLYGMDDEDGFIDAMANGAGHCDAAALNRDLLRERRAHSGFVKEYEISDKLPQRCVAWVDSPYADLHVHYVVTPVWQEWGAFKEKPSGKWVD